MTEDEITKLAIADRKAVLRSGFELAKWLIATLFLLNGAAALAVLGRSDLDPLTTAHIALYFTNGLLASIISGVAMFAALMASYGFIMQQLRARERGVIGTGLLLVSLVSALTAVVTTGVSVRYFITGVETWARISIVKAELQVKDARTGQAEPQTPSRQAAQRSAR
jgi:hypothetical protein